MNKIGVTESPYMLVFLMLPQFIISAMSNGLSEFNSGYLINLVISFIAFCITVILSKKAVCSSDSKYNLIINIIFTVFLFSLTVYNYSLCTEAISSVSSEMFKKDIISFLPVVSAVLCAYLGIEALSRSSYVFFYGIIFIIILITILTFKGWDTENLYPILGSNFKNTIYDFNTFFSLCPLLGIYILRSGFREKNAPYIVLKKSVLISFIVGLILFAVCIMTIPYPMGELYKFSLEGIFSMAKSGSFFHRFELLLIVAVLIFDIVSVALGLYLLSLTISELCKVNDAKPFILIFSVILFYINHVCENDIFVFIYNISSLILIAVLIIKSQILNKTPRKG